MDKVKNLGQVYTPIDVVERMCKLSVNSGRVLEPSAGEGIFSFYIINKLGREVVSIEIDNDNYRGEFLMMDFFEYLEENKFPTIMGNPPYVSYKNIGEQTLKSINNKNYLSLYDNRTNLYIYFIRKCVEHLEEGGEMILITPREFIKATSSISLNNFLYENGTITNWYEYGDDVIFRGYSPTVVIWRYEKNNYSRITDTNNGEKEFCINNGQISFTNDKGTIKFSDLFFVKVGAVSGMDDIFISEKGNKEFVCSYTKKTGELKRMFYNVEHEDLYKHKDVLINRKIKKFTEDNWWKWGRGLYESESERIYVNCKTRDSHPFFTNDCKYYDGSLLAIFPKVKLDLDKSIKYLNGLNWDELGFKVGGRLCFSQKSLENIYLPEYFKDVLINEV